MKDNTEMNITNNHGDEKPEDPLAAYTLQQRRTIIKGLRILARVSIHSHMCQMAKRGLSDSGSG